MRYSSESWNSIQQMIKSLSKEEQIHLGMSQIWLGSFLKLCAEHSDILDWKIDNWTADLLKQTSSLLQGWELDGITERQVEDTDVDTIKTLIKNRGDKMFVASSSRCNKFINLEFNETLDKPYAFASVWDPGYLDMPSLSFVANSDSTALAQFEELFIQFMSVNSPSELNEFRVYLKNLYA